LKNDIINSIKSGKKEALPDIYKTYRNDFIEWAVANYNVTIEEAKDVFQDIIIAFYNNILEGKLIELNCELRTFLFQIGKFKLLNHCCPRK
jgi:DNA-directed RNA polymerase specialized sigma24 family protein